MMVNFANQHQYAWPISVSLNKQDCCLEIEFDDGSLFSYSAEYLRVESPSVEVRGHGASQRQIIGGCRWVQIQELESIGNYAIRIIFNDGHTTGIYSWSYLYGLGVNFSSNWNRYLKLIEALGISR